MAAIFTCKGQDRPNPFALDNYTIPVKGREIGKVVSVDNAEGRGSIVEDTSGLFMLDRNNVLKLKKNNLPQNSGYKYEISVSLGRRQCDFILVRDQFLHNKVIAHRGAWKNTGEAENSIGALRKAIEMGCEGAEFDVHMSEDSVLFIHHDPDLNGVRIEKTKSSDLAKLRLSNSEYLPTLAAYLKEGMAQNKTKLILEIKPSVISPERTLALTDKVVAMVHAMKAQAWVDYISFSYDCLKRVRQLDPAAKLAFLAGGKTPLELKADKIDGLDYHFSAFKNNPGIVKDAREAGISTNFWTVNDIGDLKALLAAGADVITTNEPELLFDLQKNKR